MAKSEEVALAMAQSYANNQATMREANLATKERESLSHLENVNSSICKMLVELLNGQSTLLFDTTSIAEKIRRTVLESKSENVLISLGYGGSLSFEDGELKFEETTPTSYDCTRTDIIKATFEHYLYYAYVVNHDTLNCQNINTKSNSKYSNANIANTVAYLQEVIGKYHEFTSTQKISEDKGKML